MKDNREIKIRVKDKYRGKGRPRKTEYEKVTVIGLDGNWKGVAEL
jgi:hypothetical protein